MKDALPFALALLFNLAQPILDGPWRARFKTLYDPDGTDGLLAPAGWVADTAQFLPSAALTIVGIALLFPSDVGNSVLIAFVAVGLILTLVVYLAASTKVEPSRSRRFPYTWLQGALVLLNVGGLVFSLGPPGFLGQFG